MHEVSTTIPALSMRQRWDDYPRLGSVCSGGRYDDLASHYIVKPQKKSIAEVLTVPLTDDQFKSALNLASSLRNNPARHERDSRC